jgi:hypothetical protein
MQNSSSSGRRQPPPSRAQSARYSYSSTRDMECRGLQRDMNLLTNQMGDMRIEQGIIQGSVEQNNQMLLAL